MKLHALYYTTILLTVLGVGFFTLGKNAQNVTYGTDVASLQRQLSQLQHSKTVAEAEVAKTNTLTAVADRAEASGFVQSTTPIAVTTQNAVATLQ